MTVLMAYWEEGFRKHHPGIRFATNLMGTETAIAGLYTGVADIGLLGREIWPEEMMGFRWMHRDKHRPLSIDVATGSSSCPEKTAAVGVFVHVDNPITKLTLPQVGAIFGGERTAGSEHGPWRWGDVGLDGPWSDRPMHLYGHSIGGEYGVFFRRAVLGDSFKWNCGLREFADPGEAGGRTEPAAQSILEALAEDPLGIAYAAICDASPGVKSVALAAQDGDRYVTPTRRDIANRAYPLARGVKVYIDRPPGEAVDPKLLEFLRYVLSGDGQRDVERARDYMPLPSALAMLQLRKLEPPNVTVGASL